MGPVDWASPDKGTNLRIALDSFHWEIPARFLKKILSTSSRLNLRNEASAYHGFGNSFCSITAVKWDAYDVEIISGKARLCQPRGPFAKNSLCLHPSNWAELFIFPARPLIHIQNFYEGFRGQTRPRKPGQPGWLGSY